MSWAGTTVEVRRLETADIQAVLAIQAESPEAAQWSRAGYERAEEGEFGAWVAVVEGRVEGFLVLREVTGETEILNLAIAPGRRRAGIGTALLGMCLDVSRAARASRIFLEVRESNAAAIQFYHCHGFVQGGHRPRYYNSPPEDALILSRALE